ncbi:LppM family (lipo)protein [Micromonospora sp. NPDC049203]|uniref:LppM family (lipo)protein n=1 Tax=Micromonospora sp. NPDC049203 TaxID=3364267 RepID=UPI00371E043A
MNTRLRRRTFGLAACLALVAILSGCMQLNLGLTVNNDDTVSGQLLLTAPKSVLKQRNPDPAVAFAELRPNIPSLPPGAETRYEDATSYGIQIAYRKTPLAQFTSESVNLVRDDDLYRFSLPLDPKKYGGKVGQQDPRQQQAFLTLMEFEISVTFPGRVLDTNGTVTGRSVTWKVVANQPKPAELRAVAQAPPPPATSPAAVVTGNGSFPWLAVAGAVIVLLLVVGVALVLLMRRRRSHGGPDATATTDPGATGPAHTPGAAPGPGASTGPDAPVGPAPATTGTPAAPDAPTRPAGPPA